VAQFADFWNDCLIVGLSKDFYILNPSTSQLQVLYEGKGSEMVPLDVIMLENELLLCFKSTL
jgi:hypothetical protein